MFAQGFYKADWIHQSAHYYFEMSGVFYPNHIGFSGAVPTPPPQPVDLPVVPSLFTAKVIADGSPTVGTQPFQLYYRADAVRSDTQAGSSAIFLDLFGRNAYYRIQDTSCTRDSSPLLANFYFALRIASNASTAGWRYQGSVAIGGGQTAAGWRITAEAVSPVIVYLTTLDARKQFAGVQFVYSNSAVEQYLLIASSYRSYYDDSKTFIVPSTCNGLRTVHNSTVTNPMIEPIASAATL